MLSKSNMNHSWGGTAQKQLGNFRSYPVVFDMPNSDQYDILHNRRYVVGLSVLSIYRTLLGLPQTSSLEHRMVL